MKNLSRRAYEVFFVLAAAICLASPWQSRQETAHRGVASIASPTQMKNILSTPLGSRLYANAAWDVLSPMDPKLLSAALDYLRPYAYQSPMASDWDSLMSIDANTWGRQLDGMMDYAGLMVQQNRQIWAAQPGHSVGQDLITPETLRPESINRNFPTLFNGSFALDNSAVAWGGDDLAVRGVPAPVASPSPWPSGRVYDRLLADPTKPSGGTELQYVGQSAYNSRSGFTMPARPISGGQKVYRAN